MKKLCSLCITLCLAVCLCTTALAAVYSNTRMAFEDWETSTYPDYVSCVCSYDDGLVILVNTEDAVDLLTGMIAQAPTVLVDADAVPYNTLLAVMDQIAILLEDCNTIDYGIGWYYDDQSGDAIGFGSTGLEFRVVMEVTEADDRTEDLLAQIAREYGDYVYITDGLTAMGTEDLMLITLDDGDDTDPEIPEEDAQAQLTTQTADQDSSSEQTALDRITSMEPAEWVVAIVLLSLCGFSWYMMQKKQ